MGQHQNADLGIVETDLAGRPQALVGMGRGHPYVDHGDVGTVLVDQLESSVIRDRHDLEARFLEEPRPLAEQDR